MSKPDVGAYIHTGITAVAGIPLVLAGYANILPILSLGWLAREFIQHKSLRPLKPFTRSWWDWVMPVSLATGATLLVKLI